MKAPPFAVVAIAGLLAAACAPQFAMPRSAPTEQAARTILHVTNRNTEDLVVYLKRGGTEIQLGVVPSLSTVNVVIPRMLLGDGSDLQLTAGVRGRATTFGSPPFSVISGQKLEWTIDYRLPAGAVIVR